MPTTKKKKNTGKNLNNQEESNMELNLQYPYGLERNDGVCLSSTGGWVCVCVVCVRRWVGTSEMRVCV